MQRSFKILFLMIPLLLDVSLKDIKRSPTDSYKTVGPAPKSPFPKHSFHIRKLLPYPSRRNRFKGIYKFRHIAVGLRL